MVAAFPSARTLLLSHATAELCPSEDLSEQNRVAAVLEAAAAGADDRFRGKLGNAPKTLNRGNGGGGGVGLCDGTPAEIEGVSLKRVAALQDAHVDRLCHLFPTLRLGFLKP